MAFYVIQRTIKKRRGCYSESDIHISPCYLKDRNYYASYNLSDVKNINIPEKTKVVINSFEAYYLSNNEKVIVKDCVIRQDTTIELIPDPVISISNDLGYISYACSINYEIIDIDPTTRFKIVYKLNDVIIGEKYNTTDSNYTIDLTEEHLSKLSFKSRNNITIELSTNDGGIFLTKTVTFVKGNTKPKLNISSYNSTSTTFTVIDTDNNLSKIEWFIDDVLKETITTDLYLEKTINYELVDNAIHTLKIVATDAENATAEKVLSISKEIMPLQSDATLQDISTKLIEIGEGFRNGKTSIINTLALKNIEANLNNTLVELSEKIKTSFDSSDASVLQLQNRITELTNQLSQRAKFASGTFVTGNKRCPITIPINLDFIPKLIIVRNLYLVDADNLEMKLPVLSSFDDKHYVVTEIDGVERAVMRVYMTNISKSSFTIEAKIIAKAPINPAYITFGGAVWWSAFDTF